MRTKTWVANLLLLVACSTSSRMFSPKPLPAFDSEGHRGARGLMPENTIPAMLHALELGVTTLEMDAAITSDGQVILSHDPYFNHEISTAPDGNPVTKAAEKGFAIYKMTYSETQQFDVGKRRHPDFPEQNTLPATKPLLADVIENAEAYARLKSRPLPFYNIETKTTPATDGVFHPAPETFVKVLMEVIEKKHIKERTIIQSFDFRTLKIIHEKYPGIRISALVSGEDRRGLQAQVDELGFVPDIYSPFFGLVNDSLIAECHAKKIKLVPWTVNDKTMIDRLKKMGVDGIISDYPNLLVQKP